MKDEEFWFTLWGRLEYIIYTWNIIAGRIILTALACTIVLAFGHPRIGSEIRLIVALFGTEENVPKIWSKEWTSWEGESIRSRVASITLTTA